MDALQAGAAGYLLKTIEGDALTSAIRRVMRGESVVAAEMTSLSPRERDILRGIARGASNKEIGRETGIDETTVKIHVQHVLRKLGLSSRVQAAMLATEKGLL